MKLNKHDMHDDFCPCTRFRAQPEFCRCGAIERAEIVGETVKSFADRLREINQAPAPSQISVGIDLADTIRRGIKDQGYGYTLKGDKLTVSSDEVFAIDIAKLAEFIRAALSASEVEG